MTHISKIARNPQLLFWSRFLVEAKTLTAFIVLFYLHRGLTLDQVLYLSIAWSVVSIITEVPSGYLADHIGRKKTMMLGVIFLVMAQATMFFAQGFWQFAGIIALISLSFSCFSGTEEALLYESLAEMGEEKKMTKYNGRLHSAKAISQMIFPMLGALIARNLAEPEFQFLIGANIIAVLAGLALMSLITEPKRRRNVTEQEVGVFRNSLIIIKECPWLLKISLNKALIFLCGFIVWRVYQPHLSSLGVGVVALGIFYLVQNSIIFVGKWHLGKLEKKFGVSKLALWSGLLILIGTVITIWTDQPWIAYVAIMLALTVESIRQPIFARIVNKHLSSHSRATTLSNLNVIKDILELPIIIIAGWLVVQRIEYVLLFAAGLCLMALLFFPIKQSRIQHGQTKMP